MDDDRSSKVSKDPALEAQRALKRYWDGRLPVDPAAIATRLGVSLVPIGSILEPAEYSGYFVRADPQHQGPVIMYSRTDALVRQRFTIAHELGHFLLEHKNAPRDSPSMFGASVQSTIERDANRFAAELLMPADAVSQVVMSGRFGSAEELADAFKVSKVAMNYRISNLRLAAW